jgi:hypothetical protein
VATLALSDESHAFVRDDDPADVLFAFVDAPNNDAVV